MGLLDVEVVAAAIGVDRHIGMDAARDGLDRKGLTAGNAVDLKSLGVACNDRADAFTFTELHSGHMCKGDVEAIDLDLLIGCKPDATVIWTAAWDGLGNGQTRHHGKHENTEQLCKQTKFSNLSERMEYSNTVKPKGLDQT